MSSSGVPGAVSRIMLMKNILYLKLCISRKKIKITSFYVEKFQNKIRLTLIVARKCYVIVMNIMFLAFRGSLLLFVFWSKGRLCY